MKTLVLFAHGKESGPWGSKIKHLAAIAERLGAQVMSPDYSDLSDPDTRVARLLALPLPPHDRLVLVGSSMGGYVSTVASQALKPDGLFLLAPAFYMPGYLDQDPVPCARHIQIMHGSRDDVIPHAHSKMFKRKHHGFVHIINGDHRLNDAWCLQLLGQAFEDFLRRTLLDPRCVRSQWMEHIQAEFASDFAWWGIVLPARDVQTRRRGSMGRDEDWEDYGGWDIDYLFGADETGESLDYYASHRMTDQSHVRIYGDGRREELPTQNPWCPSSDDPEEAKRLEQDYYAENRKISAMLERKWPGSFLKPLAPEPLIHRFLAQWRVLRCDVETWLIRLRDQSTVHRLLDRFNSKNPMTEAIRSIPLDIRLAALFGRRLLNIYGYQQLDLDDELEDDSSWWLEFEGGVWMTLEQVIAPSFVSPTFQLHFRFFLAGEFPRRGSSLPFTKNPSGLSPVLGLMLLAEMEGVGDQLADRERHLGFGPDGLVTTVLRIGHVDEWQGERGPGMGAKLMPTQTLTLQA